MDTIREDRIYKEFKYCWFCILFFVVFILSVVFPCKAMAQYEELPDRFESQVASSPNDWLDIYAFQPKKHYSGFKFYIPPGTTSINFFFTSTSIASRGSRIYLSSRIGGMPTATRAQFENLEDSLPNVSSIDSAALVRDLEPPMGYMAKRTQSSGDRVWIVGDVNSEGVLPDSYKESGQWIYVKLLDKNGNNSVRILSVSGRIKVNPEIYNTWRESREFSSPDPSEPAFDFSLSPSIETNAELGQSYTADVSFSSFDEAKDISISGDGGEYRINAGDYTNESGRVQPEQRVRVRLTSSSGYSQTVRTTLTIGSITKSYQVTTKPDPDNVVQIIYFNPPHEAGQPKNTWVESSEIEVVADASISIDGGGEYKINGSSYTSGTGTVKMGDRVRVRLKSSGQDHESLRTTLYIGSTSGVFTVTTRPAASGGGGDTGGGRGIFPDVCDVWPSLPQCNGEAPSEPDESDDGSKEPAREVQVPTHLRDFIIQNISSQGRDWIESLEMIIELPENWPENGGQGMVYLFGLLDIPGGNQYLAQMDIFENVFLFTYVENDSLVPFKAEIYNGQRTIRTNPFASLQQWEYTAEELAELGAQFYVAIASDVNWNEWLGGSFRFTAGSGRGYVHALPPPFLNPVDDRRNGSGDDYLPRSEPLVVEAGFFEFQENRFEVFDNEDHQPLKLDIRLPYGWEEMLGEDFDGINPKTIEWSVYALIMVDDMEDQKFLARSDIHGKSRVINFNNYTPVRPAALSTALSEGSAYVDLFPCIDELQLSRKDFEKKGLGFYLALVPEGNWNNFFGVYFTFQE